MKVSYQQMLDLQSAQFFQPDQPPVNMLAMLMTAPGLPMEVAIRLRTIRDRIDDAMRLFYEQRDATMTKFAVKPNEAGTTLVEDEDKDPADGIEGDRVAGARQEIEELLRVEKEGIPAIKASSLLAATSRAAELLIQYDALSFLQPLITDDIDKGK